MNFDAQPDRSSTYAYKWEKYKGTDVLPCWIADTEFRCAEPILAALHERVDHGLLGYTLPKHHKGAEEAVIRWCKKQYCWDIDRAWLVWTPGVVPAFNMASQAFSKEGEGIIVQSPNYPPLLGAPKINNRRQLQVPTVLEGGRWTIDFDSLEQQAARSDVSLFILCNPMNPAGSVLSTDELDKVAYICTKYNVVLCSDEIHCDLILNGQAHLPAGKHSKLRESSITLMAASKTFNVAGLGTSFAIIPNASVRAKFIRAGAGIVPWVTVAGLAATQAAFTQCDHWYEAQLDYLRANRDYLVREINKIEGLSCTSPDATFLLWVDASALQVKDTQKWCEDRRVGPSPGRDFGEPDFFRINYGCARAYLEEIVKRLSS
ncbi:MalY/PatB family protein [Ningiella sp. W23]|uniref:MalY/PatB family protein n=1 Tax=Ningiella sp. W23 TaxID=3023715 RepID=UPI0037576EA9